jgi:glycosyltransferase involved in cell wall biosynthesis
MDSISDGRYPVRRAWTRSLRVLALPRYGTLAASSRYRFAQFEEPLKEQGISLQMSELLGNDYLQRHFGGRRAGVTHLLSALARRAGALSGMRRFDLIIVQYELLQYLPAWAERLALAGIPYVFDFDDAIFHKYDLHRIGLVRHVYRDKLRKVISGARSVFAGSSYLADYARAVSPHVHLMPTVVDMRRYATKTRSPSGKPFTIGWIGSPSTTEYLMLAAPAMQRLARQQPVRLIAVGASPIAIEGVQVDQRLWSEEREVADLLECDVGIMPLTDDPWSRGKCAFKLIQYMACGLPVIASPVGANRDVVTSDCGLFAANEDEWVDAMRRLRDDVELRFQLGSQGRARAERQYSLASQSGRFAELLYAAAGKPASNGGC